MAAIADGNKKSMNFARKCVKICYNRRKTGASSHKKSKKRERNKKVEERFYHLQKMDDVQYQESKYKVKGLEAGGKRVSWIIITLGLRSS